MWFWICYDHLGKLILVNVFCVLMLAVPAGVLAGGLNAGDPAVALLVGGAAYLAAAGVLGPVLLTGCLAMAREIIDERGAGVGAFFHGIRRHGVRAAAMGVAYALAVACLVASAWFYPARLGGDLPWLGYGLGALACWVLGFVALTVPMAFAALVFRRGGLRASLRLGGLLTAANPGMALAVALGTALAAVAALAPPVLLLFSLAPVAVGWAAAYEVLARRYAALEAGGTAPLRDAEDDFLNRGWRDLLFPWKY